MSVFGDGLFYQYAHAGDISRVASRMNEMMREKKNTQFGLRIEIEINYVDGPWPMACCKRKRLNASNMHHTLFLSHLFTNPNFFISFDSTAVHRLTEGDTKKNAVFQPLMHFGYRIDDDGLHRPK